MQTITAKGSETASSRATPATILGMSTTAFTVLHVVISVIGILSGIIVMIGLLASSALDGWTALFLATTVLTSVTGFFFHSEKILPSHVVGVVSLVLLAVAIVALYLFGLAGPWRWIYVTTAVTSLYLNVFVLVVQGFLKIPALHALAPKGTEPAFAIAQATVLVLFVVLGVLAVRRFHPEASEGPPVVTMSTASKRARRDDAREPGRRALRASGPVKYHGQSRRGDTRRRGL